MLFLNIQKKGQEANVNKIIMTNKMNLFLDDKRMPSDAYIENLHELGSQIFINREWEVVENYNEFVKWIIDNGIPEMVSFDHDLAPSHYTPEYLWSDYEKSKEWQDAQIHTEKTGAECAEWLVNYCLEKNISLPFWTVHSSNPVGRDKIIRILIQ